MSTTHKTRTFIGAYRELYPEKPDWPSMRDSFSAHPYPGQGKLIYFMMHANPGLVGMCSCYDVLQVRESEHPRFVCRTGTMNGGMSWFTM